MKRIVFCGVGALGSTAAWLCRNLAAELCFIDFDRVETKNLSAQTFVKQSVGKNKAEALKLQLSNFFGIKSEAFPVRLGEDNIETLCSRADLLVDCFDNQKSRQLLSDYARRTQKPLVHGALSADGTFGLLRWDQNFVADAEEQEGQATCEGGEHLPFIGQLSAVLARAIQDFLKNGVQRDAMVTLASVVPTQGDE